MISVILATCKYKSEAFWLFVFFELVMWAANISRASFFLGWFGSRSKKLYNEALVLQFFFFKEISRFAPRKEGREDSN